MLIALNVLTLVCLGLVFYCTRKWFEAQGLTNGEHRTRLEFLERCERWRANDYDHLDLRWKETASARLVVLEKKLGLRAPDPRPASAPAASEVHAFCRACWEALAPGQEPLLGATVRMACCRCGGEHASGIYGTAPVEQVVCGGTLGRVHKGAPPDARDSL